MLASWTSERVYDNDWGQIVQLLERGRREGDIFSIDNFSPKQGQAKRLSIEFDEETTVFMPIMVVETGKPFFQYENPKSERKWVEFAGSEFPDSLFTDDFDLIISMVREFYETGWVKALKSTADMAPFPKNPNRG